MYTEELYVMTYNVQYQALYGQGIKSWCGDRCASNIAKIITTSGKKYDFIALQEIKSHGINERLLPYMGNFMKDYEWATHTDDRDGVVTIWNKHKFTLENQIGGSLETTRRGGRPYLITIFNEKIILITPFSLKNGTLKNSKIFYLYNHLLV